LKPFSLEGRYRRSDGQWRWLRSTSQPRWGPSGEHAGFVGVAFDVTDARNAAEHQRLLINELNHRVKNTLATVQSLAIQSMKGAEPEDGLRRFERRLMALSKAHDVLTAQNWEGAELSEIVRGAVEPFQNLGGRRFRISGPAVRLTPKAALALAMAFHELGTNAVKYGALSVDGGEVDVGWSRAPGPTQTELHLVWRERGGPPVQPPEGRGFGSRLLERGLAGELKGETQIEYHPAGVICTITAPLS
jgi:two-component sensor histidine kinase